MTEVHFWVNYRFKLTLVW